MLILHVSRIVNFVHVRLCMRFTTTKNRTSRIASEQVSQQKILLLFSFLVLKTYSLDLEATKIKPEEPEAFRKRTFPTFFANFSSFFETRRKLQTFSNNIHCCWKPLEKLSLSYKKNRFDRKVGQRDGRLSNPIILIRNQISSSPFNQSLKN